MNAVWKRQLTDRGAQIEGERVQHFGHPEAERNGLATATTLHPIADGLLSVTGDDAGSFLHGQLTSDISALTPTQAQHSAYCTAKGRMLATFLVTRSGVGYLLQLPRVLVEPIAARLQKYVLRAKVTLTDASDTIALLGLGGPRAAELIATVLGEAPTGPLQVVSRDGVTVIALEGECYELTVAPERAAALWDQLSEVAHPAGGSAWEWRRIAAGIPWITPATQEAFVPQMANLEQVGAVSFSKGCYPGQEIVARAQYLGEVKRRLFRGHSDGQSAEGQELFALAGSTQSIGMVVNAAPAPGGGTDFLAVVQTEVAESGGAHVGGFSGPRVLLTAVAQPQAA